MRLLYNRVAINPDNTKEDKEDGINIETGKGKPKTGTIVFVSTDIQPEPGKEVFFRVGDKVLYPEYFGFEFEWENQKLIIVKKSDILAIL